MLLDFSIKGNTRNVNGILFTQEALDKAMSDYIHFVDEERALGRTNYSPSNVLDLSMASFIIKKIEKKGSDYFGDVEVLDTPEGIKLKDKISETNKIGLAMIGDLDGDVVKQFEILYPVILTENNEKLFND